MKFLFFYSFILIYFMKHSTCIYDDSFIFTFKNVKKVNTSKNNVNKFEIEIVLTFNIKKSAKEFFLVSLIPGKNLQILSFKKEDTNVVDENVEFHLNKIGLNEKDSCDYLITSKMYLLKLSTDELKKFKIYKYPFKNKENTKSVPPEYEYSEKSLKNFFSSEGVIYPSNYYLKISVEILKEGLNSEGAWIFSVGEKKNTNIGNQECTIYYDKLAEIFLQKCTSSNLFLLYCNSTTNAEILNLVPDLRKTFDVQLSSSKKFYGAHESTYSVEINFNKIKTTLKTDKVMISIKLPMDLCYANSCFNKNFENPCMNIKPNVFEECTYLFRSYEFLLKSKISKDINNKLEISIQNISNPLLNLESDNKWVIDIYTVDVVNFIITEEHKGILEKVSNDICSKNFINKFIKKYSDSVTWVKSHIAIISTPELTQLIVKPIDNYGLLENPLIVNLKLLYSGEYVFNKCLIELKSIHRFTSVMTKSEYRLNVYNYNLLFPNSTFKPVLDEEHILNIEKDIVRNNDTIQFAINVKKYKNNEYWFFTLKCLNKEQKYIKEAQSLFIYPIENKNIYISDLYYKEKVGDNKYIFYLNLFVLDEKELEIKLSILSDVGSSNIQLSETCDALIYTSCYNLVYHECSKEEKNIIYHINSYKSTNKHFTILFPLVIMNDEKKLNLQVELETKNNPRKIKNKMVLDVDNILKNNLKTPCVNNLIYKLKKYKKYESHLFLLFKAVNCEKIYEPFLVNFQNNETFYAKVDSLDNSENFTFQKTYKQMFPINYDSISQKIFDKNIISIITIILIDSTFLNSLKGNYKEQFLQYIKRNVFFSYNKYYVVTYSNTNLLIELYKYIDAGNVKIDIVQKSSGIDNIIDALEKTISFAEGVKKKENVYFSSEYSILLLTDVKGISSVKTSTNEYVKNSTDINKTISRIYVVSFEKGDYTNNDIFNESLQKANDIYIYNKKTKEDIYFFSFHKYIIDEKLLLYYSKSILQDYLTLHTQIYKTSWYLIGICRNNIIKNSLTNRKLHLYYVDKNVKTVNYTLSTDETHYAFDNSSLSSFQDMCNIFTQLKLLGYN
ncbi:conserved Plasmodium protein, unknown function [Plasmodium gallinaceum]|uniref:VWFA domain-containing protein n=1 Tax=Plasmodium gallinaceum TaxID=5849 RepID=A0A1J1GMT1_PLAGA|nr:conserved Plasmodium protein, unknown function [Plasmodium gallinaceum]CRG93676.1 conserved Plasmodium protein, unknown function [Plasmodium gallinaceum]